MSLDPCVPFATSHWPPGHLEGVDGSLWRVRTTHPTRSHFRQVCTTLVTWDELSDAVRIGWEPPKEAHVGGAGAGAGEDGPPNLASHPWIRNAIRGRAAGRVVPPKTLDALLLALRETFLTQRAAILVSIRSNRVALFVPFANERFAQSAQIRIKLVDPGDSERVCDDVATYASAKMRATGVDERATMLADTKRWWFNGHVICNVLPRDVWGDGNVSVLHHMFMELCHAAPVPDVDLLLNRRDAPLGRVPIPTLDLFGRKGTHDLWPHPEDWMLAMQRTLSFPEAGRTISTDPSLLGMPPLSEPAWAARKPVAVFRGSTTGYGVDARYNTRLKLFDLAAAHPDLLDVQLTGYNTRDRVAGVEQDGDVTVVSVTCPPVRKLRAHFGEPSRRVPLSEQVRAHRYAICVEGHQAAARLGALLWAGVTVLYVFPSANVVGPDVWITQGLRMMEWSRHEVGDTPRGPLSKARVSHLLPVKNDLSDLADAVRWCNANPRSAFAIARAGQAFVRTHAMAPKPILLYMRALLWEIATTAGDEDSDSDSDEETDDPWFGVGANRFV